MRSSPRLRSSSAPSPSFAGFCGASVFAAAGAWARSPGLLELVSVPSSRSLVKSRGLSGNFQPDPRHASGMGTRIDRMGERGSVAQSGGATLAGGAQAEARLLVVEDDPNIVELLSASLRFAGFTVQTAASGGCRRRLRARIPPRSCRTRRDAARPRRIRGGQAHAGRGRPYAGGVPDRSGRDRGQDPRSHARRRRLRHQAVQPRGADRADPCRAAAYGRRGAAGPTEVRRPRAGRGVARGLARTAAGCRCRRPSSSCCAT